MLDSTPVACIVRPDTTADAVIRGCSPRRTGSRWFFLALFLLTHLVFPPLQIFPQRDFATIGSLVVHISVIPERQISKHALHITRTSPVFNISLMPIPAIWISLAE